MQPAVLQETRAGSWSSILSDYVNRFHHASFSPASHETMNRINVEDAKVIKHTFRMHKMPSIRNIMYADNAISFWRKNPWNIRAVVQNIVRNWYFASHYNDLIRQ